MTFPQALAEGDAAWAALTAALDACVDVPASTPGEPWNARDVYAHLARWQADSVRVVSLLMKAQPLPEPDEDEAALNARWAAKDASMTLAAARERCLATRDDLRALMLTLTDEQWRVWGWKIDDIVGPHYRDHLAALDAP